MAARSPLPSPPLSAGYSYDAPPPPLMTVTTSSANSTPAPANRTGTPQVPPPPAPPTQPSTIAPPPIQTASDMENAEKIKKKHVCPTCSRPFTTSGHLARHLRVHTGERNHKCPFPGCETRCSRQDNLQQHYRIHLSPRSRRNSNAATRAAIAKAMEAQVAAQANGHSPQQASSPSTTLTLPPQAPRHHQSQARPPASPIENALGLDSATNGAPPPPYHAPARPNTLQVHHPSSRYPSSQFGYESPRSSSASSSVHGGPNGAQNNPSAAYPSPYSNGPGHHPLPPTGGSNVSRGVSYDRVANQNFSSPQSPAPPNGSYPSPDEHHPPHHGNGYNNNPQYPPPSANGYNGHATHIPPPHHAPNGYYAQPQQHYAAPPPPPASGQRVSNQSYSSQHNAGPVSHSPPPILPPIHPPQHHHQQPPQSGWARPGAYQQQSWHTQGPAHPQSASHASSSDSGDEAPTSAQSGHASWNNAPARPQVAVNNGASY